MIFNRDGEDATYETLGFQEKSLLLISYDLDNINPKKATAMKTSIQLAENEELPISIITSSVGNKITDFINQNSIGIPIFLADDIDLKTIIRSNPGLILLENGKVIKKWAVADFPVEAKQINE